MVDKLSGRHRCSGVRCSRIRFIHSSCDTPWQRWGRIVIVAVSQSIRALLKSGFRGSFAVQDESDGLTGGNLADQPSLKFEPVLPGSAREEPRPSANAICFSADAPPENLSWANSARLIIQSRTVAAQLRKTDPSAAQRLMRLVDCWEALRAAQRRLRISIRASCEANTEDKENRHVG